MPIADAELLRTRARGLRNYGAFLRSCEATTVYLRSDTNTWIGATPEHCLNELTSFRNDLRRMNDDLVSSAIRLERDADAAALVSPTAIA